MKTKTDATFIRRQLARIQVQLGSLGDLAANDSILATRVDAVSGWGVGEHVEHLLVTNRGIYMLIEQLVDGSLDSGNRPSLTGRLALAIGRIPRGRGKAPRITRPSGRAAAEIRLLHAEVRDSYDRLGAQATALAACRATAPHPYFGPFTPAMWLRFIDIHDRHHQAIIADLRAIKPQELDR